MKFAYTILYVRDVSRSLAFYESAFGLQRRFLHESGMYGELDTGATTLTFVGHDLAKSNLPEGFQPSDPTRPPAAFEVAFATTGRVGGLRPCCKRGRCRCRGSQD